MRYVRTAWRYGRWLIVAAMLPMVIAIQLAIVLVHVWPYDPAELVATTEPLVLVDVRGEPIATFQAAGADRTHWTKLADIPAIAVSAVIESEDEHFWEHDGVDGRGVARAVWLNLRGGRFGGSTLTMQLARMLETAHEARTMSAKL
ncbi:MAG: transglycosylase domain-containing protein, partial [Kofleriaceae bacterium]